MELKKWDVTYQKTKSFGFTVKAHNQEEAEVVAENLKDRYPYRFYDEDNQDWGHDAITTLHSITEKV